MPKTEGVITQGVVIERVQLKVFHRNNCLARIRFQTVSGETIECLDPTPRPQMFVEGQRVDVVYDPNNPQDAKIPDSWFDERLAGYSMIGLVFFIVVILFFWLRSLGH